jgi:hypothetical protein
MREYNLEPEISKSYRIEREKGADNMAKHADPCDHGAWPAAQPSCFMSARRDPIVHGFILLIVYRHSQNHAFIRLYAVFTQQPPAPLRRLKLSMAKACYSWTPSIARALPGGAACSPRLISIRVRVRVRAIRAIRVT